MNKKTILAFAIGPIGAALLGIIVVPFTAWIFPAADVGRLNILQIAISFSLLFFVLGLDQAYVREYNDSCNKSQLFANCFFPGFIILIIFSLICIFNSEKLSYLIFEEKNKYLCYGMLLAFVLEYINRFLSLILRMREEGWTYSIAAISPKIAQLLILAIFFYATIEKSFLQLMFVILFSQLTLAIILLWCIRAEISKAIQEKICKIELANLLKYSLPLLFSGVAYWGLIATTSISLRNWSNLEELAIYSVANSFAGVAGLFQSIFSVVWYPIIFKWVSNGDVDIEIIYKIARKAMSLICIFVVFVGMFSWMADFILPQIYINVKYILVCLLLQPLLYTLAEITSVGIGIKKKSMWILIITAIAFIINLVLCFILVPKFGAIGAATANSISFTFFFIFRTEVSAKIWKKFPRSQLYLMVLLLLSLCIFQVYFKNSSKVIVYFVWTSMLILTLIVYKAEFKSIIVNLNKK